MYSWYSHWWVGWWYLLVIAGRQGGKYGDFIERHGVRCGGDAAIAINNIHTTHNMSSSTVSTVNMDHHHFTQTGIVRIQNIMKTWSWFKIFMIPFHVSLEAVLALRLSCIIVANMFHVPLLVLYKPTRAAENWEHFIPVSCSSCAAPDYDRLTRSLNFNCCLSGLSYCEAQIHYEIVRAVHRCMHQPRGATTHFSSRGNPFQCQFLLIFALFCHQVEAVCPKVSF